MKSIQKIINKARIINNTNYINKPVIFSFILNKHSKILCKSINSYYKTHPKQFKLAKSKGLDCKIYLHSEIRCLIKYSKIKNRDYKKDYLVTMRFDYEGNLVNAKPCVICSEFIRLFKIKNIFYSNNGYIIKNSIIYR